MTNKLDKILISYKQPDFDQRLVQLRIAICQAATFNPRSDEGKEVVEIIEKVLKHGDKAVAEYTEKFDDVKLTPEQFLVSKENLEKAHREIDKDLLTLIHKAIENVRQYQAKIFIGNKSDLSGETGIKYKPIKRVGICVPGASAPLPSTVIMTAVPAQVAGVKEIAVVSPPRYKGSIHPVILAICRALQIKEVYRIGGAQAVAALASGTDTIRGVDKIVGPGNMWVQTAKRLLFGEVGIDSIAGPSEVLIIANDKANPAWVAADMLSQAEHAPGSALTFTDSDEVGKKILDELKKQVGQLSRADETSKCLKQYSGIAVFNNLDYAIDKASEFAVEHLQIQCGDESREVANKIENAGAIFIGDYSPVAVGDYWAGPSHTLPTGGGARFSSALTSNDFIKSTSIIEYDRDKLAESAADIIRLAEAEGLDAHAKSIKIRQQD
ncbi:MAG: histidinol dehydrogenase [Sedimentisphaerales bacterium]